jgi:hypothetical protein
VILRGRNLLWESETYRGIGGTEPVGIEPLGMVLLGTLPRGTVVFCGDPMVARVSPVSGMVLPGGALPGAVLSIALSVVRLFMGFWLASVLLSLVRPPDMVGVLRGSAISGGVLPAGAAPGVTGWPLIPLAELFCASAGPANITMAAGSRRILFIGHLSGGWRVCF